MKTFEEALVVVMKMADSNILAMRLEKEEILNPEFIKLFQVLMDIFRDCLSVTNPMVALVETTNLMILIFAIGKAVGLEMNKIEISEDILK